MASALDLPPPAFRCRPPFWARGGHAQTILGHLLTRPRSIDGAQQLRVPVSGGDELAVRHHPGTSGVVVHLFHGMSGCAESDYMLSASSFLAAQGHAVLATNHRGCGAGRGLARGVYSSACAPDLAAVIAYARKLYPGALQLAIGYSLSGNGLLFLSAHPDHAESQGRPDGAIAVNPPVDLADCVDRISSGWNRLYDLRFVRRLRRMARERSRNGLPQPTPIPVLATLRQFDELYTAPLAGFRDADDYYARCSAGPYLASVGVPTVILTAADDPFVDASKLRNAERSNCLCLHVEPHGGHLGYITRDRTHLGTRAWLDAALSHYVEQFIGRLT